MIQAKVWNVGICGPMYQTLQALAGCVINRTPKSSSVLAQLQNAKTLESVFHALGMTSVSGDSDLDSNRSCRQFCVTGLGDEGNWRV